MNYEDRSLLFGSFGFGGLGMDIRFFGLGMASIRALGLGV
jgi:hypothetical protein